MTTDNNEPYLICGLLCDDVRQENNGKEILIGVYGSDVMVGSLPASIAFTLWLRFFFPKSGTFPTQFRATTDKGAVVLPDSTMNLVGTVAGKPGSVVLGGIIINVTERSDIRFEWKQIKGEWQEAVRFSVSQGTPPGFLVPQLLT